MQTNDSVAITYHVLIAKTVREGTLLGGAEDRTAKFGPLKVVLGAIPPRYANHGVRLRPPAQDSLLTNTSPGICRCREQDSKHPLANNCTGRTFRLASN